MRNRLHLRAAVALALGLSTIAGHATEISMVATASNPTAMMVPTSPAPDFSADSDQQTNVLAREAIASDGTLEGAFDANQVAALSAGGAAFSANANAARETITQVGNAKDINGLAAIKHAAHGKGGEIAGEQKYEAINHAPARILSGIN
jgi:hypothetical protein